MSFAVEVAAAPASIVRRIRVAMFAFAVAACILAFALAERSYAWWIGVVTALLFALACRRGLSLLSEGRLSIDACGAASWHPASGDSAEGPIGRVRPVRIERWSVCGPLIWLSLRFADEIRARDLLLLRARDDDERWRRLRAWLLWYGRGRAVPRAPASITRR